MVDESSRCYRHPDVSAAVDCRRCGKPICPKCMKQAAVGSHCVECVANHAKANRKAVRSGMSTNAKVDSLFGGRPPVTVSIMVLCGIVLILQGATSGAVADQGRLLGVDVANGEVWRLITSGFLHAGLAHIGFNMYGLWLLGNFLERGLGSINFALLYLAGLLGGSAAIMVFAFDQPTVGASGAVLGSAAAIVAVLQARGQNVFETQLVGILALNILLPLFITQISFWGHLGGAVGGYLAGLIYELGTKKFGPKPAKFAIVGFCIALFAVALTAGLIDR